MTRPISRVLIANRGEVAVRIARSCREMGIGAVAVYSEADRHAMHTREADAAVEIGQAASSESYLRGDRLIEVARAQGCQAIHPGYGFLSQNADFAEAVAAAGLIFIGPPPAAMRLMGDKTAARRLAQKAGVPVIPGTEKPVSDPKKAAEAAAKIGFPVIIKAAFGGGGRGMRVVLDKADLEVRLAEAQQVAKQMEGVTS